MSADDKLCPKPGCGAMKIVGRPCYDWDCPQQTVTSAEHIAALEASEAKIAALTAERDEAESAASVSYIAMRIASSLPAVEAEYDFEDAIKTVVKIVARAALRQEGKP